LVAELEAVSVQLAIEAEHWGENAEPKEPDQ